MQEIGLFVIGSCVLLLALTNMYLVWRLIKGVRFEDEKLESIAQNSHQLLAQQLTVRHIVSDPSFLSLFRGMAAPATESGKEEADAEDAAFEAALKQSVDNVGNAALGVGDLLTSLNDATDMASWKAANQARINELLRSQGGLKAEVEQLQTLLTKANATILNLRARNLQGALGAGAAGQKEIDSLKAAVAARDTKIAAAEAVLKNEKTKFETEKKQLTDKIAEMQAAFDRTIVEKNFIEDAFIEETKQSDKSASDAS